MELRADERALAIFEEAIPATEQDWETEFLDFILAVKVVDSLDEAIQHINRYNTKHSESIISDNYFATQQFFTTSGCSRCLCECFNSFHGRF